MISSRITYDLICFLQESIEVLEGELLLDCWRRIVTLKSLVEDGREVCHDKCGWVRLGED